MMSKGNVEAEAAGCLIINGLITSLALVAMVAWLLSRRRREGRPLPGPFSLPILGSSIQVGSYPTPWKAFSAFRDTYGDVYGLKLGSRNCVVVSSPETFKEVLVERSDHFSNRPDFLRFHAIFRGDRNYSIALCDWSNKQKARREIAFPYMHPRARSLNQDRMNMLIQKEMSSLVSSLKKADGEVVEPRKQILFATGNVFYQFFCCKRFEEGDQRYDRILTLYDAVFKQLFQGFAIDFMPWLKIFNQKRLGELRQQAEEVSETTAEIFKEHLKTIDYDNPRDLVDIFLDQVSKNSEFTEMDAEIIIEDLIGGHPVLGNLWLWGLYFLAANPEVRAKMREEVLDVTGGERYPSMDDRSQMPYTEATIYELLRVVASPIIPHVANQDTMIQGFAVPKDSMIMFNNPLTNMDPNTWESPLEFKPQRFINSEGKISKPSHFIPFGVGKRTCLGGAMVKSILFLGMSTLVQEFDIVLPEGVPPPNISEIPGIVIPKDEYKFIFHKHDCSVPAEDSRQI